MILLHFKNFSQKGLNLINLNWSLIQKASITGRGTRGGPLQLKKPFPYEEKKYKWYHEISDATMLRISEENAKIVVVEGPIGVGKTACAQILAEQLDMKFMPPPTMDEFYLLPSGYDMRQHDHELPKCVRSYDHKNFCVNPTDNRAAVYQLHMLYLRFVQYLDAICHILNTGQGVVLERSYFSDFVFMKAMYNQKYVSRGVHDAYYEVLNNTNCFFPPPHLIIYLDIPVPVVQERILTRGYSYEQNSPALTTEYLGSLEKYWKQEYLKQAHANSEILVYNWTDGGDVDVLIEDIEKLDFDVLRRDKKFYNWRIHRKQLYIMRKKFTNNKRFYTKFFNFKYWKVPEFDTPNHKLIEIDKLYQKIPECQYEFGYNQSMGDKFFNILFKTKVEKHRNMVHHFTFYKGDAF